MNNNYYVAAIFIRNCNVEIRVNDIPLIRQSIDGEIYLELPVNYLIEKSGKQSLSLSILPNVTVNSVATEYEFKFEIYKYDARSHLLSHKEKVMALNYSNKDNTGFPKPKIKHLFDAEVGYEISRWSGCKVIEKDIDIKPMVVSFLKDLTQMLKNKQYDKYSQLIYNRERNICKALYLGQEEIKKRMDMLKDCLDNGFEYVSIEGHKSLQYFGNRRVVSVVGDDMKSVLQFYNQETGEVLTMDLLIGIPDHKKGLAII